MSDKELVVDDHRLTTEQMIDDLHALRLVLTHQAPYGVVTVMASASINDGAKIAGERQEVEARIAANRARLTDPLHPLPAEEKARLEREIRKDDARRRRCLILQSDAIQRYRHSAYRFGEMWGKYYNQEQPQALGGRFVPLCTGGGPGLMEAAAHGAWAQSAKVIGLDSVFGNYNHFNIAQEPYYYSTIFLRCNDFSVREEALVNHAHVILFWPGGFGTAWEACETLSKLQTQHLRRERVKAIFVHTEFWQPFFDLLAHFRHHGTLNEFDDFIRIPGIDDTRAVAEYLAMTVDSADEAFTAARAHIEHLHAIDALSLS